MDGGAEVIEATLFLIVGLMVLKLTAVWLIWRRMDRFQFQFDRLERLIDDAMASANSPLWFREVLSVNSNKQQEATSK